MPVYSTCSTTDFAVRSVVSAGSRQHEVRRRLVCALQPGAERLGVSTEFALQTGCKVRYFRPCSLNGGSASNSLYTNKPTARSGACGYPRKRSCNSGASFAAHHSENLELRSARQRLGVNWLLAVALEARKRLSSLSIERTGKCGQPTGCPDFPFPLFLRGGSLPTGRYPGSCLTFSLGGFLCLASLLSLL